MQFAVLSGDLKDRPVYADLAKCLAALDNPLHSHSSEIKQRDHQRSLGTRASMRLQLKISARARS